MASGEAHAIAQGTRCDNYMFSMSFNPPEGEQVGIEAFEKAIDQVEAKLGLQGQPRAVVFHEKDGRRHAHAVWSRIDAERMRSINMNHYKAKLRDVSRELFFEHGWNMPRGLEDQRLRDPLSFSRSEWQQAKRIGVDPKELKAVFKKPGKPQTIARPLNRRSKNAASCWRKGIGARLSPSIIAAKSMA